MRRFVVPAIFATIFIIVPMIVIGYAIQDDPLIMEEPASP